jgi:hypothetical protein
LEELALRRQQSELAVQTAREDGRPSLDLTGSLSPSGTSDGWGGSLSDAAGMEARGYGAALTLTMPLDNVAADARLEQAMLVGERLRTQQAALEVHGGARRQPAQGGEGQAFVGNVGIEPIGIERHHREAAAVDRDRFAQRDVMRGQCTKAEAQALVAQAQFAGLKSADGLDESCEHVSSGPG